MDDPFGNRFPAEQGQGVVGEVRGEQDVVLANARAEQRGGFSRDGETKAGQDPGVVAEETIAVAEDVAMRVRNQEDVAMLQHEKMRRHARVAGPSRFGRNGGGYRFQYHALTRSRGSKRREHFDARVASRDEGSCGPLLWLRSVARICYE